MTVSIAIIGKSPGESDFATALKMYTRRIGGYATVDTQTFSSETLLFQSLERRRGRTAPYLVLLDSRGRQFSSEKFAQWMGRQRDQGQQTIVFAIGPADGWSDGGRKRANLLLSLGSLTLPHELALVVLSEQIYRAFTILSGHPYHTGH